MIDNTSDLVQIPFDPFMGGKVSFEVANEYLSKFKHQENRCTWLQIESGDRAEVCLSKEIGYIKDINWIDKGFVADVVLIFSEYKTFALNLINSKQVVVSWSIGGSVCKNQEERSEFCYFVDYREYKILSIDKIFYFFLKRFEK